MEHLIRNETKENSRGIPSAVFIEDVPAFLAQTGKEIQPLMRSQSELYSKYKFMEAQLLQQKKNLLIKIPDIKNALQAVEFLIKKQEADEDVKTQFELADNVFANATLKPNSKVCLWLGANVMLEYDYEEAQALLQKNLEAAQTTLSNINLDLAFLKEQITISEVNIARVHNHNVRLRQLARAAAASS
eukprot:TRINITY_DN4185_c0_g3_i1.p1 TRINITY_DN4185_c0_g3~~TRINITY_DN4185_c0_g3_i1.p1  ORF type:complete len:205 (+),score=86.67 TRINITY_DN4185_c0_g3_i1:53-616(+)